MNGGKYVLVTAACNEERFIAGTLESVVAQTVQPLAWVVVSDGSTDRTDEIVSAYAGGCEFIHLLRLNGDHARNFAAQANAINAGWRYLRHLDFGFIGNLDADVTFSANYFADLLGVFGTHPRLGLAGGRVVDEGAQSRGTSEDPEAVPHTTQMFRRECFETMNGYLPLQFGGADTYACVMARMHGWEVKLVPELIMNHHRLTSSANGVMAGRYRQGRMDFSLGYHPACELLRCVRRVRQPPVLIGSVLRLIGFATGYLGGEEPIVTSEYIRFSRAEQSAKVRRFLQARGTEPVPTRVSHS